MVADFALDGVGYLCEPEEPNPFIINAPDIVVERSSLDPSLEQNWLDTLAWSLQHQIQPIRSLLRRSTSLDTCRYIARLQLEHLRRAGVLVYRRPAVNHGHFRPGPRDE